jgi:hypothetical protein
MVLLRGVPGHRLVLFNKEAKKKNVGIIGPRDYWGVSSLDVSTLATGGA